MKFDPNSLQQGTSTNVSPPYDALLAADSGTPHPALLERGDFLVDCGPVPRSRYWDTEVARLEKEHIWRKCWQFAARVEEVPEVGDRVEYTVAGMSFIIVRSGPDSFKALWNSCLHRGTKLCVDRAGGEQIKCPFHGWAWNLDGSVRNLPGKWDFPQTEDRDLSLPEAKVGVWGGNIFINPDQGAGPLEDALGVLIEHFKDYDFENRWTAVHVRKKVRANWKTVMEAFLEGWHLSETHGQAQSFNGDSNSQYDVWEDEHSQVSRSITPSAVPSPELGDDADVRQAVIELCKAVTPPGMPLPNFDEIPELDRKFAAQYRRQVLQAMTGRDSTQLSDAEMLDAVQYFMFPNWFPWWGEGAPLLYQYMPLENPEECIMDIRFLLPLPANGERPPAAQRTDLDFDEGYQANNVGFGLFDEVFDQDMSNVPMVRAGMREGSPEVKHIELGLYQECRIRALQARVARLCGL